MRCADKAGSANGQGTVIVKAYPPGPDGENSFAAEAAGLALAGDTGLAPELLAADRRSLTVVMSDLAGRHLPGQQPADSRRCPVHRLRGVRLSRGLHDAAYLRMPFSTCWCVFRLPPELRDAAEARYRAQALRIWPELADDGTWERGVRRAVVAWSLGSMWWLLGRALSGDASLEPDAVAAPRTRQLMRHRWQVLAGELEAGGEFPAISAMARALLAATADWHADELPLYPALR